MIIKTKDQWIESGKPLDKFLQIDDLVDFDIVNYIFEQSPPATWNGRALQMGKASLYKGGKPYYLTIEIQSGYWVYTGFKRRLRGYYFV